MRAGYQAELDEAVALRDDSRNVMAALEARYIEETGVKALKVRHNNILGYFIEVTQLNAKPLLSPPLSETFRHRQTMSNAMRFTTSELVEIEGRIASAERALDFEQEIFAELGAQVPQAEAAICNALAGARRARCDCRPRGAGAERELCASGIDDSDALSKSAAVVIRWSSRPCARAVGRRSSRTIACWAAPRHTPPVSPAARTRASGSSPGRTWPASRRFCARTR